MTATALVEDVFEFLDAVENSVDQIAKEQEVSTLMMWMLIKQLADKKLDELTVPYKN